MVTREEFRARHVVTAEERAEKGLSVLTPTQTGYVAPVKTKTITVGGKKIQVTIEKAEEYEARKRVEARTLAISGLSYEARKGFLEKATTQEKKLLRRGTEIKLLDIGTAGTLRMKYDYGTELIRKERREWKDLDVTTTLYVSKETREPLVISKRKEPIRKISVSKLSYGQFVERELEEQYKIHYGRRYREKIEEAKAKGKWKEEVYAKKWGASYQYYPKYSLEKIPGVTEFKKGYIKEIKEKPIRTIALTGISFVAPGVLGAIGKGVRYVAGARAVAVAGKVIGAGVTTAYGISIVKRIGAEPTYKLRAERLGRIVGGEITPVLVGGLAGAYILPKVSGYIRTIGRKEIPTERLVSKKVIKGITRFPVAPRREHLKLFLRDKYRLPGAKKPMMYHAMPERLRGLVISKGTSEFPGLYGAPGISPHFLKIAPSYRMYGTDIFGPAGKPGILAITPTKFIKGFGAKPGVAFVPGVKTEVEAILPPTTRLIKKADRYFFKWLGRRIPIGEYGVAGAVAPGVKPSKPMLDIMKSYYLPTTYPITTPSQFVAPLISRPSYRTPSRPSPLISRPSYRAPTKPSLIQISRPSKLISRAPSYVPGIKPSYVPSFIPSYSPGLRPGYLTPYVPTPRKQFVPIPIQVGFKPSKRKIIPIKAVYGYVPSYREIFFKRYGKPAKPKFRKRYTGFQVRKIPVGFRWSDVFKKPTRVIAITNKPIRRKKKK